MAPENLPGAISIELHSGLLSTCWNPSSVNMRANARGWVAAFSRSTPF